MINRRAGRWSTIWLVAITVLHVGGFVPPAAADGECTGPARIFAVDLTTGHLVQIPTCRDTMGFGPATVVDSSDWRAYSNVFAVQDGEAAVLYAVTATGQLWWRRQPTTSTPLSAPVRIAPSIDWSASWMIVARSGYLYLYDGWPSTRVRTLWHQEWVSGGSDVSEQVPLFAYFTGPRITGYRHVPTTL